MSNLDSLIYLMGWLSTVAISIFLLIVLWYLGYWYFCAWRQLIRVRYIHRRQGGTPVKLTLREWFSMTAQLAVRTPNLVTNGVVVYYWKTKLGRYY